VNEQSDLLAVGRRIASARKNKGLRQEDLGDLLGVTKEAVSAWERGRSSPHLKLQRIAEVLDVPVEWLSYGDSGAPSDGHVDREAVLRAVESLRAATALISRAADDLESSL
jgi:transcriptional regulator with XRE-family HTH domain